MEVESCATGEYPNTMSQVGDVARDVPNEGPRPLLPDNVAFHLARKYHQPANWGDIPALISRFIDLITDGVAERHTVLSMAMKCFSYKWLSPDGLTAAAVSNWDVPTLLRSLKPVGQTGSPLNLFNALVILHEEMVVRDRLSLELGDNQPYSNKTSGSTICHQGDDKPTPSKRVCYGTQG